MMPLKGIHTCIDFHGKTPLSAKENMWEDLIISETRDGFGFVLKDNVNDLGYQSVTSPGSLKAYYEAVTEFGSWDWSDIVKPAIKHAEDGFIIRPHVDFFWNYGANYGRVGLEQRLKFSKTGREAYFNKNGNLKRIGDHVKISGMTKTLQKIAKFGPEIFYKGEIAEKISQDMLSMVACFHTQNYLLTQLRGLTRFMGHIEILRYTLTNLQGEG